MQRTWWPVASTTIFGGSYQGHASHIPPCDDVATIVMLNQQWPGLCCPALCHGCNFESTMTLTSQNDFTNLSSFYPDLVGIGTGTVCPCPCAWWQQTSPTQCGQVTPYGDRDLGQHWLGEWLVAWRHQSITWTNVDWSSSDIHIRAISHEMPQPSITEICCKLLF